MRKKLFLAIALLGAFLAGCSDSDSSSTSSSGADETQYTVVVFGTAQGAMDSIMEDVFDQAQSLMESKDVRVLFCYKYGTETSLLPDDETGDVKEFPFTGKYAKPGQLVAFELTKDTDLKKIAKKPVITADANQSLYEPGFLAKVLNYASDSLPAQDYVLLFYGHGGGFDFEQDYPKDKRQNVILAKTQNVITAGLLPDEWDEGNDMNMYEIRREIEKSSIKHFKAIYFHNCLIGNMELLSEIYSYADYIVASEHELASDGVLIVDFIKELYKGGDFEKSMKSYLDNTRDHWKLEYKEYSKNGDLKVLKTSEFETLFPIFKKTAKRLNTLYKDSKQINNIGSALLSTYEVSDFTFDALDYVQKVAKTTKDSALTAAAKELKSAFDKLIVKKIEVHYNEEQNIDAFTLSVMFTSKFVLDIESDWGYTYKDAYEYTKFHKETGWGDWLYANEIYQPRSSEDDAEEE